MAKAAPPYVEKRLIKIDERVFELQDLRRLAEMVFNHNSSPSW